jgi:hypothetical protein
MKTSEINSFRKHKHYHKFHGNTFLGTGYSFGKAWLGSKAMFNPSDGLSIDNDNTFLGGIAIPWSPVVKNCPIFNQNFDRIVKQAANATTTGTRISRINYGAKRKSAALLVAPEHLLLYYKKRKIYIKNFVLRNNMS